VQDRTADLYRVNYEAQQLDPFACLAFPVLLGLKSTRNSLVLVPSFRLEGFWLRREPKEKKEKKIITESMERSALRSTGPKGNRVHDVCRYTGY
jgi:hypothetical protein